MEGWNDIAKRKYYESGLSDFSARIILILTYGWDGVPNFNKR